MHSELVRVKDSIIPAAASGIINAVSAYAAFRGEPAVALSVDSISSPDVTVWSRGASLAFTLGVFLSCVAALKFRRTVARAHPDAAHLVNRPFFPFIVGLALQNALSLFGMLVVVAVLWQRFVGTVTVGAPAATLLVGVLAFIVASTTETRTKRGMLTEP